MCGAVAAQSPQHKKNEPTKSQNVTESNKSPAPAEPIVVEIKPPSHIQVETTTNEQEAKEKSWNDWWLVKSTIWLAAVTTALAVFTGGLWLVTYRLAKGADKSSSRSEDLSIAAATAYRRAERAWIAMSEISTIHKSGHDEQGRPVSGIAFLIHWINAGHTPAVSCTSYQFGQISSIAEAEPSHFAVKERDNIQRATTIAPGITTNTGGLFFSHNDIELLKQRKCRIFLYGLSQYNDVFSADERRHVEVCLEVIFVGMKKLEDGTHMELFTYAAIGPQNTAS